MIKQNDFISTYKMIEKNSMNTRFDDRYLLVYINESLFLNHPISEVNFTPTPSFVISCTKYKWSV
jgi:hypothetical protein